MNILPNDLGRQYSLHAAEYEAKALEVLRSGWYILGREVEQFEKEWAEYIGSKYCVGLASGLDALWISFRLLGIGRGDEVIVCSNAYIACVMGISMNGATPVFVEPDEYDNIDAEKIEAAITPRTKAILAVHLFGQGCDMTRIMDIARSRGLKVVEDCAQSHGNHWEGRTVGTFGDVGCFSFYPTKGCGAFGVGTNSRLDELQAGLLRGKLSHLPEFDAERRAIAGRYLAELHHPLIRLPKVRPGADSTWHQFVIHVEKGRDELAAYLKEKGIGTIIHYPIPPHLSEAYRYLGKKRGDYPIAERYADEVLSLPMYNGMTEEEQTFVIEAINAWEP